MYCIKETHKKLRDIDIGQNIKVIESMREEGDRKGGGIMVLYKIGNGMKFVKEKSQYNDFIHMSGVVCGERITVIVVYFALRDKDRIGIR